MRRAKKGNQWFFDMKIYVGADVDGSFAHIAIRLTIFKCSGEVDLKFGAVCAEQAVDLVCVAADKIVACDARVASAHAL